MAGKQGKSSKMGRNSTFCAAYKAKGQREKNRKMKMLRHMRNHPGDEKTYQRFGSFYPNAATPNFSITSKGMKREARNLAESV